MSCSQPLLPTRKQRQFFADNGQLKTPYLLVDLDVIEAQYRRLMHAFPFVKCYYAVKCNPAAAIIRKLRGLGARFETASLAEIELCLEQGVDPGDIHFGNTIKSATAIREAYFRGVHSFSVDCEMELLKVARHAPHAKVSLRLETDGEGATFGLDRKFGASADDVLALMLKAEDLGMNCYGVAFHVGSQQMDPGAWVRALENVATVFERAAQHGIQPRLVNLGGGFPVVSNPPMAPGIPDATPDISAFGKAIRETASRLLPADTHFVVEPGRYLAAEAGVLRATVLLVSERGAPGARAPWLFLDVGRFNGLHDAGTVRFPMLTEKDPHHERRSTVLAGPTCDGDDILYDESAGIRLPATMGEGDTLYFLGTGVYTTTFSTVCFNGFPALAEYYI